MRERRSWSSQFSRWALAPANWPVCLQVLTWLMVAWALVAVIYARVQ